MSAREFANLLHDFGPAVANHLWQSTAFAALAAALAFALRKNQARVRYWIWMAASLKFLVPFALLASAAASLAPTRVVAPADAGVYMAVDQVSEPFVLPALPVEPVVHVVPAVHWGAVALAAVWVIGFFAVLAAWCVRWRRVARAVRSAMPVMEGREFAALERIAAEAGVRRTIEMRVSDSALEPGVFGIARPVLLWPAAISARLDAAQLDAVLAHEVCHVRRRDNLTALLHMFVEAVFWFHPLVWWLGARLLAERERACDEAVVALCPQPQVYAESILKVCEFCVESPLACVSGVTGADLKRRVVDIMTARPGAKLSPAKKSLVAIAALAILTVPIMSGLLYPRTQILAQTAQDASADWERAAGGPQSFEVASIRESKSDLPAHANFLLGPGNVYAANGGCFSATNLPLLDLIRFAYKLTDSETNLMQAAAPKWISTDHFDIEAKSENHSPSKDQMRLMVRSLLMSRFNLKVHSDMRDMPVLAMVLARPGKFGPQLRPHPVDGPACLNLKSAPTAQLSKDAKGTVDGGYPAVCGGLVDAGEAEVPSHVRIGARDVPLRMLASNITLDRPLVDQTGLHGNFDFFFEWGADPAIGSDAPTARNAPGTTLEEALRDQLGIKLVRRTARIEVLVIDHVEHPTPQDDAPAPATTPAATVPARTQPPAPAKPLNFEVVSIRENRSGNSSETFGFPPDSDRFRASNAYLVQLIEFAYGIQNPNPFDSPRVIGLPGWASSNRYDIEGKIAPADIGKLHDLTPEQRMLLLKPLLSDRFRLQAHFENRQQPGFDLVVLQNHKGSAGLNVSDGEEPPTAPDVGLRLRGGSVTAHAVAMSSLAQFLQTQVAQPVIDRTGLHGTYDFHLTYAPRSEDRDAAPSAGPSIFTAVQEQLGLRLVPRKEIVSVLVIDHIDRPTEN